MFKESVGEIFVDLTMNLSKNLRLKTLQPMDNSVGNAGKNLSLHTKKWKNKLKGGFFSKVVDAEAKTLGDSLIHLKSYLEQLAKGKINSQTNYLKEIGLTGKENELDALQIVLNSLKTLKRKNDAGQNGKIDTFLASEVLANSNANSKKFGLSKGLEKTACLFEIKQLPKWLEKYILSNKRSKKIGVTNEGLQGQTIPNYVNFAMEAIPTEALQNSQNLLNAQDKIAENTGKAVNLLTELVNLYKKDFNSKNSSNNSSNKARNSEVFINKAHKLRAEILNKNSTTSKRE